MKTYAFILLILLAAMGLFAQPVLSCYDVQYTTATDGASPYIGQIVTVQGVVTGTSFYSGSGANNYGFFLADAAGGAFSGLFIYNQTNQPSLGDLVRLTGTVTEYYNFTEITSVSSYQVISQNNPLPQPTLISTNILGAATQAEQWESVLVKVQNVTVVSLPNSYQEFDITDGSGNCQIDNQFFPLWYTWQDITIGRTYSEITGIVDYGFSAFGLNPRSLVDMLSGGSNLVLSLPTLTVNLQDPVTVSLNAVGLDSASGYQSYSMNIGYNPNVLAYQAVEVSGTLSQTGTVTVTPGLGNLGISYSAATSLNGQGTLIRLIFSTLNTGVSALSFSEVFFGETAVQNLVNGSVTVNSNYNAPGDILTVIQRPIMNIPAIQIPGESMAITCLAPQNTTGFNAWLVHGNKRIALPLISSTWQTQPNRWELLVTVPQVNVFELYNLEVNANGGIHDISRNAVHVVPSRKSSYYFVHVTDLHMPTRIFYPDAGYDSDSLAVNDFRAVLDDINIIRPEFVLLTGDLVNEGELEDFNGQYVYGWAQRVISELQVPVYVTAGNHDIGGWTSTPPSAGSSRRNWWKYFGWSWLDNTDVNWPYHTQDYFFTYNNTLFIGLESYDNYDNWRTNIYGTESYTDHQMQWLSNTIGLFPGYSKLLFHHYDFQEELNLSSLGIDMALWGHIHSNNGDVSAFPYNLATRSTCDGNRAYRVVRVNNDQFTPLTTIYTGSNGNTVNVNYFPSNYAVADSVMAVILNGQFISFENALIKFNMPAGNSGYTVSGGVLEQVDRSGAYNVCYVRTTLNQYSTRYLSIKATGVANQDLLATPMVHGITSCYPNPVRKNAEIVIESDKSISGAKVEVYNLKGQKVQEFSLPVLTPGSNTVAYTPLADMATGIYFLRLKDSQAKPYRFVIVK